MKAGVVLASGALLAAAGVCCAPVAAAAEKKSTSTKRNVLLLIADDLRPQLNRAYGMEEMHTPNLDAFADSALTFDHAYTNFPICECIDSQRLDGILALLGGAAWLGLLQTASHSPSL